MRRALSLTLAVAAMGVWLPLSSSATTVTGEHSLSAGIHSYFSLHQTDNPLGLKFPKSVKRFYKNNGFVPAWITGHDAAHVWQGLLLVDCVLQYGLNHSDFHPDALSYSLAHEILDHSEKVSFEDQVKYDVLLTDAMITLINQLHYGKLNPFCPAQKLDQGAGMLHAELILKKALATPDIDTAILAVQPVSQLYNAMQQKLYLDKGQYSSDCYEAPEAQDQKIALNMERLRWAEIGTGDYVLINIPSFTLSLFTSDSTYTYNTIAGDEHHPTKPLNTLLHGFTNKGNSKLGADIKGYDVFSIWSKSIQKFDLTDKTVLIYTSASFVLKNNVKACTNGAIGINEGKRFAELLLKLYGSPGELNKFRQAIAGRQQNYFPIKIALPLKVTYLTCTVKAGEVINWPDVYHIDAALERALYPDTENSNQ